MPPTASRQELSPVHFIERAGTAYAERTAVVDDRVTYTWAELRSRARRLASSLRAFGLKAGERVAFLSVNSEPLLLAHHAIPLAGGVVVAINSRLSAQEVHYIVGRSGAGVIFHDSDLESSVSTLPRDVTRVQIDREFEGWVGRGNDAPLDLWLEDEDDLISINYTSGTTGPAKGVMCSHRGAYLNSLAMALDHRLTPDSVYLWTLPMFHCNGWMFPWALAAVGGQSVCLGKIEPTRIWEHFDGGVSHFCAAPTVLTMLAHDPAAHRLATPVRVFVAGSPPTPALLAQMETFNFEIDHVYGLTETSGPFTINSLPPDFATRSTEDRARLRARQGVSNVCAGFVRVVDEAMCDVSADGQTMGEIVMQGNIVMPGYYDDVAATREALEGGWFHSGDLGVMHPDGAIEVRDRKKDIIISGGENISTIEVEQAVASHPAVMECAVVATPDEKWGEAVKAIIELKPGVRADAEEIIEHCRRKGLGRFKVPQFVEFSTLPRTSTGKIQKYRLRKREWEGGGVGSGP